MKKEISKKLTGAFFILTAVLFLLAGCNQGSENEVDAVPFSEAIGGEGVHIWYECQNKVEETGYADYLAEDPESAEEPAPKEESEFGRETRVVWVKVYADGKLSTYTCKKNVYLGYFARMTDEEIIKALDSDKERFVCGQKEEPYKIYIYSDSTGHEIRFEGVPTIIKTGEDEKVTDEDGEEVTLKEIPTYFMPLISEETVPTFQIYDSYYGGYVLYNYDETPFGGAALLTRCEEGTVYGMGGLDLADAVVDYDTPEDLLNELNEPFRKQRKERAEKYHLDEKEETAATDTGL